ncbi:hypothetical protein ACTXT7_003132 [Hymenolepis weldensis]
MEQYQKWLDKMQDFYRGLNISLLRSPPNLNDLDEQLVDNLRYRTKTLHLGVQICIHYPKHFCSRYATVSSEPKTDTMEINLDACDLPPPWHLETPETQRNHRPNQCSRRFRRPWRRLKADLTLKHMDKQLSRGGAG